MDFLMKKYSFKLSALIFLMMVVSLVFFSFRAMADDDEDDDDHEERSSSSSRSSEPVTTVTKDTRTVVVRDSDGDGLFDNEDPHPDLPEIYIVVDEDRNGIVDTFENGS